MKSAFYLVTKLLQRCGVARAQEVRERSLAGGSCEQSIFETVGALPLQNMKRSQIIALFSPDFSVSFGLTPSKVK